MAKPSTFATSVVTPPSSIHLNVSPDIGYCVSWKNHDKNLVEMTVDVIVLSFIATGAHNLNPASCLLITSLLVSTF